MIAKKPAPGSSAFKVLVRLQSLGGNALMSLLMPAMAPSRQLPNQLRREVETLQDWHLARLLPGEHQESAEITAYGSSWLLEHDVVPPKYVGKIVPEATTPEFRPLNMAKLMAGRPQREGMDDCAGLPSLMGGKRVVRGSDND